MLSALLFPAAPGDFRKAFLCNILEEDISEVRDPMAVSVRHFVLFFRQLSLVTSKVSQRFEFSIAPFQVLTFKLVR